MPYGTDAGGSASIPPTMFAAWARVSHALGIHTPHKVVRIMRARQQVRRVFAPRDAAR